MFFHFLPSFVNLNIISCSFLQISHRTSYYWQELTDSNGKTVFMWEIEKLSRADSCNSEKCSCQIWFTLNRTYHYELNIQFIFLRFLNIFSIFYSIWRLYEPTQSCGFIHCNRHSVYQIKLFSLHYGFVLHLLIFSFCIKLLLHWSIGLLKCQIMSKTANL